MRSTSRPPRLHTISTSRPTLRKNSFPPPVWGEVASDSISHEPDSKEVCHSIESCREHTPATQVRISGGRPRAHAYASGRSTLTPFTVKAIGSSSDHSWRARPTVHVL